MPQVSHKARNLIREGRVLKIIPVARGTLRAWYDPNSPYFNPRFPRPFNLGGRAVFWFEDAVEEFISEYAGDHAGNLDSQAHPSAPHARKVRQT
jgi:predicted DNA-binding transcriptional regulator AlpA